jgi:hypothetical protein
MASKPFPAWAIPISRAITGYMMTQIWEKDKIWKDFLERCRTLSEYATLFKESNFRKIALSPVFSTLSIQIIQLHLQAPQ